MTMILVFGVSALGKLRGHIHACLYAHTHMYNTRSYTQAHLCV